MVYITQLKQRNQKGGDTIAAHRRYMSA